MVNLERWPIRRATEHLHLLGDAPTALRFPLPNALDELGAPEIVASLALARQLAFDDQLRGDARVVDARLPERVVTLHPLVPDEHVLNRVAERVPHVQRPGDVGGGIAIE